MSVVLKTRIIYTEYDENYPGIIFKGDFDIQISPTDLTVSPLHIVIESTLYDGQVTMIPGDYQVHEVEISLRYIEFS